MRIILRLMFCATALCLLSCTVKHGTVVRPSTPLNQCKSICEQRFQQCLPSCANNCTNCSRCGTKTATANYIKYVHEKRIEGVCVARELNSYYDPLQCRKVSCNCYADLSVCTQGCTGVIQKRLRAVPYCI